MRLQSDLVDIMDACINGTLEPSLVTFTPKAALGVVVAAEGYPGKYNKGMPITGIDKADALGDVKVFHSGTSLKDGEICSIGGRVLGVTALGDDLEAAQKQAYKAVGCIAMPSSYYRSDIGQKGVARLKKA
jgi:phosphoribosylamine--glycine ligase